MTMYAHSACAGRREQTYAEHIRGVREKLAAALSAMSPYLTAERLRNYGRILSAAAEYHDLGKLNANNQAVLSGRVKADRLPVAHQDAGVKLLLGNSVEKAEATLVFSHHKPGLPNIGEHDSSGFPFRFPEAIHDSDLNAQSYLETHMRLLGDGCAPIDDSASPKLSSLDHRMLLSCLVDADYSDTGGERIEEHEPRWDERLQRLKEYVERLSRDGTQRDSRRNELRRELFRSYMEASTDDALVYCDSPVGTGKTTAVLAHMLGAAMAHRLRQIFIILPYTGIITQTVKVLREAIVLDGEDPRQAVAELHHHADYSEPSLRHLASTWSAPIIVTTAVQFFETLAACHPAKLRKQHRLPGSGVVLDEYHAALPVKLMPLAWRWLTELSSNWGCRICMCSATTMRFWEMKQFIGKSGQAAVPLLPDGVSERLNRF